MNENQSKQAFALCINNEGYEVSLEVGKLYRLIPDETTVQHGYLRIVDESGEDYAYSANRFYLLNLPDDVEEALLLAH